MSKPHVSRLKEKYPGAMEGENYRGLMTEIISANHQSIQSAVARVKRDEMGRSLARIKRSTTAQIALPDLSEVLPKRSVYIRKGAEQGQILTDTLRDRLTSDLRSTVAEYLKTGAGSMQYRRGEERGRIRPELVKQLRESMESTFKNYRKAGPEGVPSNISAIAETEARSAIDDIKHTWATRLEEANPGKIQVMKVWRHFPSRSNEPRGNHSVMDGAKVPLNSFFMVPHWIWRKKTETTSGAWIVDPVNSHTHMQHPHDPSAPIEQVISCHCECDYVTEIL